MRVRFQLFGCVQAWDGDRPVGLGPRKQRLVLAVLALEVNRLVPANRLIDLIWPADPPASARGMIHTYVSKLRAILDRHEASSGGAMLRGEPGGYQLCCDPECVDVHRFRALTSRARDSGDDEQGVALLDQALALWHGPALAGSCDDEQQARLGGHLDEARLGAVEDRFDALLRLGRHHEMIDELVILSTEHPDRQRLTGQLMLALHRAARTADALRVYDRSRRRLAEESGLDPADELQHLHGAILRSDPALTTDTAARAVAQTPVRPAQVPADLPLLSGRRTELDQLLALRPITDHDPAVVVVAIDGMAGVGKTALAVHAAHRLAPHFPDGQLFLDLHGHTHGVDPVEPADALDRMVRTLGIPGERIPPHLDDRAALWRSLLAGRRLLVLLDNAANEAQVQPLLPGSPGSLVLITSRSPLAGLDHTRTLSLDILPPPDALTLFTRTVGPDRVSGHPASSLDDIVQLCGGLPLALRIAAARLRTRPGWTSAHLADRLRDQQHRLGELEVGGRSVTAAIDLSYHHLSPDQQRLYRLLGLHPGADLDGYAAAALADTTLDQAERWLGDLLDAHLLIEPTLGRYRFHDLVRAHATHTATRDEPEPLRHAAVRRLLDHYTHTAEVAADTLYPRDASGRPRLPPPTPAPDVKQEKPAAAWLDTELDNLIGAATHAATHGWPTHTIHLSTILHRHLRTCDHHRQAQTLHTHAVAAARDTGDRAGEIRALVGLGIVHSIQVRLEHAADCFRQALTIARDTGDRASELTVLVRLGYVDRHQGRLEQATDWFRQALNLAREAGDRTGRCNALAGLGHIHRNRGRLEHATDSYQQALNLARDTGDRASELNVLAGLANVYRLGGEHQAATEHFQETLDLADAIGNRNYQFEALLGFGHLNNATGHPDDALTFHQRAQDLAVDLGQPDDQARAHDGLARAHDTLGDHEQARHHWQRALHILTDLDLSTVEEVSVEDIRACLADLDQPTDHTR